MAICIEGDANGAVTQQLLEHFGIDTGFQQQGSRQMSQRVEGHPLPLSTTSTAVIPCPICNRRASALEFAEMVLKNNLT